MNLYISIFFTFLGMCVVVTFLIIASNGARNYIRRKSKTKVKTTKDLPLYLSYDALYEINACSTNNYLSTSVINENVVLLSPNNRILHFMVPHELDFEVKFDKSSGKVLFFRENMDFFSINMKNILGLQVCFQIRGFDCIPFEHNIIYKDNEAIQGIKRKTITVQGEPQWKILESLSNFLDVPIYNCLDIQLEQHKGDLRKL